MFLTKDLQSCKSLLETDASLTEVNDIQITREASHEDFQIMRRKELDDRRASVQQWLGFASIETRHEDASTDRHPGTGKWLLQHPKFQAWFDITYCMTPVLWLNGKPGAGKSRL